MRWQEVYTAAKRINALPEWHIDKSGQYFAFFRELFGPSWGDLSSACPGCANERPVHNELPVELVLSFHPHLKAWAAKMLLGGGLK